jgi:curved DNA-binding protein CbpA
MNYYQIFDIPLNSSPNDIRIAFKKLAVKHHPDKGGTNEKFIQIKTIYETLSDSNKKIIYDRSIRNSNIDDYLKKNKDIPTYENKDEPKEVKKEWYQQSRKNARWTILEEELLKKLVKEKKSYNELAELLRRSITAIKSRVSKLQLSVSGSLKTGTWIDDEEELLTKLFNEDKSVEEIAKQLNRSVNAIKIKIKKLKLQEIKDEKNSYANTGYQKNNEEKKEKKKPKRWTKEEEVLLTNLFKTTSLADIAIKFDRSVGAIKARCTKLKLKKT